MKALPKCCEPGHKFQKYIGLLMDVLVCVRCGKKVRFWGA